MKALLEVEDELAIVKDFVECVFMSANEIPQEFGSPMRAVLNETSGKLDRIIETISDIRQGRPFGAASVAADVLGQERN